METPSKESDRVSLIINACDHAALCHGPYDHGHGYHGCLPDAHGHGTHDQFHDHGGVHAHGDGDAHAGDYADGYGSLSRANDHVRGCVHACVHVCGRACVAPPYYTPFTVSDR